MKRVFMPLVWAVQWFGRMLRLLWNRRSVGKSSPASEKKKDGRVGGIVLGIISAIIAIVGIFVSVTPSDLQRLETTMQQSFDRMEQLDYLIAPNGCQADSAIADNRNMVLRGKAKLVSSLLREEIDCINRLDYSVIDDDNAVSNAKQLMEGYSRIHALMTSFETNATIYLVANKGFNEAGNLFLLHFGQLVSERGKLFKELEKERNILEIEMETVAKNANKKKAYAICKQYVSSKTAMKYNYKCIEEINLLYDWLVIMQLYDLYGEKK